MIDTEMLTDDEALRTTAMADGPRQVGKFTLRPMTALTVSWAQRNEVFTEKKDMVFNVAAFMFLHTEPLPKLRAVVNNRAAFIEAVDAWIEKNIRHHLEIAELSRAMNESYQLYTASASTAENAGSAAGN
jgi:hypothetical protein